VNGGQFVGSPNEIKTARLKGCAVIARNKSGVGDGDQGNEHINRGGLFWDGGQKAKKKKERKKRGRENGQRAKNRVMQIHQSHFGTFATNATLGTNGTEERQKIKGDKWS